MNIKVGDTVKIVSCDLWGKNYTGVVKRLAENGHLCLAVEITHREGEPIEFDGHNCDGACGRNGWYVLQDEVEVIG